MPLTAARAAQVKASRSWPHATATAPPLHPNSWVSTFVSPGNNTSFSARDGERLALTKRHYKINKCSHTPANCLNVLQRVIYMIALSVFLQPSNGAHPNCLDSSLEERAPSSTIFDKRQVAKITDIYTI